MAKLTPSGAVCIRAPEAIFSRCTILMSWGFGITIPRSMHESPVCPTILICDAAGERGVIRSFSEAPSWVRWVHGGWCWHRCARIRGHALLDLAWEGKDFQLHRSVSDGISLVTRRCEVTDGGVRCGRSWVAWLYLMKIRQLLHRKHKTELYLWQWRGQTEENTTMN